MVVATICNHKGGTGKTTSALGLAAALGLSGRRVLLVDLDPQAFLTRTLGANDPSIERSSLALLEDDAHLGAIEPQPMSGFDLLPAHGRLTRRMRRLNKPTDVLWIKETVERSATDESQYDVLLFDTAAAVTVYSLNALVASRHALIPVTPEYQPVVGAEQTWQTARMVQNRLNPDLRPPSFLLTQVDGRKKSHTRYQRYLRERYEGRVLDGVIRTSSALTRTPQDGSTVFDFAPHARGARDYANAADEWFARLEAEPEDEAEAPDAPAADDSRADDTDARPPEPGAARRRAPAESVD
jgi:chromosome partitioning protein